MIHGADRFKASKVYKENPLPHEEAKQQELWIAEGNIIRDLDRTDLIQKYEQISEDKKQEYIKSYENDLKSKLCFLCEEFNTFSQRKIDYEVQLINGGQR